MTNLNTMLQFLMRTKIYLNNKSIFVKRQSETTKTEDLVSNSKYLNDHFED